MNWTEGGVQASTLAGYSFAAGINRTLVANFAADTPTSYTVTVSANPVAGGTVSGGGTYNSGATVTLGATAASGYHFVNWTEGGVQASTLAGYSFAAGINRTLVANFAADTPTSYTVTVSANPVAGGTVSGGGTYNSGATVTLGATAASGYHFVNWTEGGVQASTLAGYSFAAGINRTLVANFAADTVNPSTFTIVASDGRHGSIDPSGTVTVASGESQIYTITPDSGYHIASLIVDGSAVGVSNTYTFANVNANHIISVAFAQNDRSSDERGRDDEEHSEGYDQEHSSGYIDDSPDGVTTLFSWIVTTTVIK